MNPPNYKRALRESWDFEGYQVEQLFYLSEAELSQIINAINTKLRDLEEQALVRKVYDQNKFILNEKLEILSDLHNDLGVITMLQSASQTHKPLLNGLRYETKPKLSEGKTKEGY